MTTTLSSPDTRLLPCPFCGGTATMEQTESNRWSVGCDSADEVACMGYQNFTTFARRSDATKAWNTRPCAAQSHRQEPVAYACFTDNGNIRLWSTSHAEIKAWAETIGRTVTPLYPALAHPVAVEQPTSPAVDGETTVQLREAMDLLHKATLDSIHLATDNVALRAALTSRVSAPVAASPALDPATVWESLKQVCGANQDKSQIKSLVQVRERDVHEAIRSLAGSVSSTVPACQPKLDLLAAKKAVRDEVGSKLCMWCEDGIRRCYRDCGRTVCMCEDAARAVLSTVPQTVPVVGNIATNPDTYAAAQRSSVTSNNRTSDAGNV